MQVAKWGNSLAVRLPAELVKRLGLTVTRAVAFAGLLCGLMASPALVMTQVLRPKLHAATVSKASQAPAGYTSNGRFALPPVPPHIEGAPDIPYIGPGAPTLDMSVPPKIEGAP